MVNLAPRVFIHSLAGQFFILKYSYFKVCQVCLQRFVSVKKGIQNLPDLRRTYSEVWGEDQILLSYPPSHPEKPEEVPFLGSP